MDEQVIQQDQADITVGGMRVVMRLGARDTQQDAAWIGDDVAVVADGMGGHADGALASRTACNAFADAWANYYDLHRAAAAADAAVCELVDRPAPRAPGTTLVAAHVPAGATIAHGLWCGDSRAYRIATDGTCEPLTEDHTGGFGGLLRSLGRHDPDDHPATFDTFTVDVAATAGLLLCTDGLSGPFDRAWLTGAPALIDDDPAATIAGLLTNSGPHELADVAQAHGTDNVTALWWPLC
jgi:PPM family protein phosphatase